MDRAKGLNKERLIELLDRYEIEWEYSDDPVEIEKSFDLAMEALLCTESKGNAKEPKRPTGRWIDDCTCSNCNWLHENDDGFVLLTTYNYCPNCGANMKGNKE